MGGNGWIGVDLDATLAKYDGFKGPTVIGEPIPAMVDRVKAWIAKGYEVRIMTARVWTPAISDVSMSPDAYGKRVAEARYARRAIEGWTELHIGKRLEVTCQKDYSMWQLYDDRAVQVEPNTGRLIGDLEVKEQGETLMGMDRAYKIARSFRGIHFTKEEADRLKAFVDEATEINARTT